MDSERVVNDMPKNASRVFSAPGKAMMAGGYLVLDPQYNAYVTALSSRMHARVEKSDGEDTRISVRSPQFGGSWDYRVIDGAVERLGLENPFLEATLKAVLAYRCPKETFRLDVTLFSDPGYHTQENTSQNVSRNGKRRFLYHEKRIELVPKTGMGLSAGLVSVVTMALLTALLDSLVSELTDVAHNLAQIAHCDAQGKIGSGFDVAAAIYGSIVYRRFQPELIHHLLGSLASPQYSQEIQRVANLAWNFKHAQCALPPGIKFLMGDVNGGSETPKLVSKVLQWKKEDRQSAQVYSALEHANESFIRELENLWRVYKTAPDQYELRKNEDLYQPLAKSIKSIRRGLQQLTNLSGAGVEPKEQSVLLDKCETLPGCLGGVVPGAGGYDAICLLVLESKFEELKAHSAKDPAFSLVTWLDLSEEATGVQEERPEDYEGL